MVNLLNQERWRKGEKNAGGSGSFRTAIPFNHSLDFTVENLEEILPISSHAEGLETLRRI